MTRRILVGTDTSAAADLAVGAAAELASARDAELLVLYVRPRGSVRDAADPRKPVDPDRYLARMTDRFPELHVRSWSEPGDAAARICELASAERVEAIVLGNRGVHGPRLRVRESVPHAVLRRAPCAVLVVDTRVAQ
jgi:nucleotide-binding universal stress UspA family protein